MMRFSIFLFTSLLLICSSASTQTLETYSDRGFLTSFVSIAGQDYEGSLLGTARYNRGYRFEITSEPLIGEIEITNSNTGQFIYYPPAADEATIQVVNTFTYQVRNGRRILNFEVTIQNLRVIDIPGPIGQPIIIPGKGDPVYPIPTPPIDPITWPGHPTY